MSGLLIFFGAALALLVAMLTALLVRQMRRPPRHTAGYAVARGLACDPGELKLAFEEWTFDRPRGVRLPVWEITAGGPPNVTAVVLHGWGHSRIDALQRIQPLASECGRLVLYDLRGHGDASGSLSPLGDGEDVDLIALLERVNDGGRFVLAGHSLGAVIAIAASSRMACENHALADRVAGIVATAPYCAFHRSLRGRLLAAGYPARPITDLAMLVHRLSGVRPLSLDPAMLQTVNVPMLLLRGTDDMVAPLEDALTISSITGAALEQFPGADHQGVHAADPSRYESVIQQFVQSIAASDAPASA